MATYAITCGHCNRGVAAEILNHAGATDQGPLWLRCPLCLDAIVLGRNGITYPSAPAGSQVPNLTADVEGAWREVRVAHAVGAYTAAEMMCRKILMHLAVAVAGAKVGKSFVEYVDELDNAGYVAPGLRPVVDQIRQRGNAANHELPASSEQDSLTTMAITEHLLRTIYELPGMVPAIPTP